MVHFKKGYFGIPTIIKTLVIINMISCSMLFDKELNKSESYKLKFSDPDWKVISPDDSDHAFRNSKSDSIIFINSYCKKYDAATLKQLIYHLVGGIQNLSIESEEKSRVKGREAIHVLANGTIDGVPIYIDIHVLKKNRCIYDFALVSTLEENRSKDASALEEIIKQVEIH